MHDYRRITKQFGISYFFTFLIFIFTPILTFLLTRFLSVEEFGIYSILAATVAVLTDLLIFGMPSYVVTKLSGFKYKKKIESIFSILFFEFLIIFGIILILFIPWVQETLISLLRIEGYKRAFQISLLIVFSSILFSTLASYLAANRKLELQSFIFFLRTCLWRIFLIIFFVSFRGFNLTEVFYMWLAGILATFLVLVIYLKKDISFFFIKIKKVSFNLFKKSMVFGLPLVMVTAGALIITLADRYMLNYYKGAEITGIYSLAYSLVSLIISLSGIISSVLYPHLAKAWNEKKSHNILFNAMLKYNILIVIPAMTGLYVLREQIITLISGPEYLVGASAIAVLITFPLFASLILILTNSLMLKEKTRLIAFGYLGGALLNIFLNIILIPKYSINGASIATVASYVFMYVFFHFASKKQFSWDFKFLKVERVVAASLLMGIILYFINPEIYFTKVASIAAGVIIYIILIYILKIFARQEYNIIKSFLPKFLHKFFR